MVSSLNSCPSCADPKEARICHVSIRDFDVLLRSLRAAMEYAGTGRMGCRPRAGRTRYTLKALEPGAQVAAASRKVVAVDPAVGDGGERVHDGRSAYCSGDGNDSGDDGTGRILGECHLEVGCALAVSDQDHFALIRHGLFSKGLGNQLRVVLARIVGYRDQVGCNPVLLAKSAVFVGLVRGRPVSPRSRNSSGPGQSRSGIWTKGLQAGVWTGPRFDVVFAAAPLAAIGIALL